MRLAAILLTLPLLGAALPAAAGAQGGAPAPAESGDAVAGGGAGYGAPAPAEAGKRTARKPRRRRVRRRRPRGPVLEAFGLSRPRLFLYGRPARLTFRIRGRGLRVRLYLVPAGQRRPASTILLGERPSGVTQTVFLSGRETGILPQGDYSVRIAARDRRGRRLRRSARATRAQALSFFHHVFPIAGPFDYGGEDARFGAPRKGHSHQGQDLAAAEGTPVVAPRGGTVKAVQYQAAGAGHYVVVDGAGEDRDYVFMHLRSGSIPVREGQEVRTGQLIGEVGNTGRSFGAHLHFEIWVGRGWFSGGRPIDPLALLRRWDAWS